LDLETAAAQANSCEGRLIDDGDASFCAFPDFGFYCLRLPSTLLILRRPWYFSYTIFFGFFSSFFSSVLLLFVGIAVCFYPWPFSTSQIPIPCSIYRLLFFFFVVSVLSLALGIVLLPMVLIIETVMFILDFNFT